MKLFHTENGKETVYVQMKDLMYLSRSNMAMPESIFMKIFSGITIIDDSNRFNFVKFEDEREVEFFKNLEVILDFGKYRNFTDEELKEKCRKIEFKVSEIIKRLDEMTAIQRAKSIFLVDEYEDLGYMHQTLKEIYAVKHYQLEMSFPKFVKIKAKKKSFFKRRKNVK